MMNRKRVLLSTMIALGLILTTDCRPAAAGGRAWNRSRPQLVTQTNRGPWLPLKSPVAEHPANGFHSSHGERSPDFYCNGYTTRAYKGLITKLP
ncbi:MAG TPA: hypothetical protein VGE80_18690 [Schlesneria sp.]